MTVRGRGSSAPSVSSAPWHLTPPPGESRWGSRETELPGGGQPHFPRGSGHPQAAPSEALPDSTVSGPGHWSIPANAVSATPSSSTGPICGPASRPPLPGSLMISRPSKYKSWAYSTGAAQLTVCSLSFFLLPQLCPQIGNKNQTVPTPLEDVPKLVLLSTSSTTSPPAPDLLESHSDTSSSGKPP